MSKFSIVIYIITSTTVHIINSKKHVSAFSTNTVYPEPSLQQQIWPPNNFISNGMIQQSVPLILPTASIFGQPLPEHQIWSLHQNLSYQNTTQATTAFLPPAVFAQAPQFQFSRPLNYSISLPSPAYSPSVVYFSNTDTHQY